MAAKPKLIAVTEYGTFTRTTDHDYKFVIVSLGKTVEAEQAELDRSAEYQRKYAVHYRQEAAKGGDKYRKPAEWLKWAEESEARAIKYDATIASQVAARKVLHGWSGRQDLAEKVANKARGFGYQGVKVFEVKS